MGTQHFERLALERTGSCFLVQHGQICSENPVSENVSDIFPEPFLQET